MYEFFNKTKTYRTPVGSNKTGQELLDSGQYQFLDDEDAIVDIQGSVMTAVDNLYRMAEMFGIDTTIDTDKDSILIKINNAKLMQNQNMNGSSSKMRASMQVAQIMAMSFTDEQALEVKDIYPEYQVDHAYKQGDFFTHEGKLYKVNQAHTSASQWEPSSVGTESLYTHLTLNEDGYPIWKQPTGAHDAYNKGDIVEYNGELYKSLIDGNAYSPDAYPAGWEKYTEPTE